MATVISQPERLVILDSVTWDTYERLIAEHGESGGTRFTYDEGCSRSWSYRPVTKSKPNLGTTR